MSQKKPSLRAYTRVSSEEQAKKGESLTAQLALIQKHCEYKGYNLIRVYTDEGLSAAQMRNRPELQKLLKDIQKDEILLVTDISRLARNSAQAITTLNELRDKGVIFQCIRPDIDFATPMGRAMFGFYAVIGELDRDNISAHTKQTMQHLRETGRLRTVPPFGYKFVGKDKDHEPDPAQQAVLKKIITMHEDGISDWKIAQLLNMENDNMVLKPRGSSKNQISEKQKKYNRMFPSGKVVVIPEETKHPQFTPAGIHCILVDHGFYERTGCYASRLPLEQRIKSIHKEDPNKKKGVPSKKVENPGRPKFVLSNLEIKDLKKKQKDEKKEEKKNK